MKCLECGSNYIKKNGFIVIDDKIIGKYKIPDVEYYECKTCKDRMYPSKTAKLLDLKRKEMTIRKEK